MRIFWAITSLKVLGVGVSSSLGSEGRMVQIGATLAAEVVFV